jgi:hypothetical protein
MSEATEAKATAFNEWEVIVREGHARRRGYLIGAAGATLVILLAMLVVWPIIDKNIYLRDDRGLGDRFRSVVHASPDACDHLAEALYGRPMGYVDGDWAPRSEKAFVQGCTGSQYMPGGD